jgi:hypothetical protein
MQTSYFSKYRGNTGVCIALKHPSSFKGECYPDLFPKRSFLSDYFLDHNTEVYTRKYYIQVLSKLDPYKVFDDLKNSTILCWEGPGKFCHRRLVAYWLKQCLSIEVPEI